MMWFFSGLFSPHIISNERLIESTIRGVKELFIRSFSGRKESPTTRIPTSLTLEWAHPADQSTCATEEWNFLPLDAALQGQIHGAKHNGWGFYERTRGGTCGESNLEEENLSFNPFQNTFQLKENQNHNILVLPSFSKLIILFLWLMWEHHSQPLKLLKWNYSTWFDTNAQMVLRSNNSYWGDYKCS